MAADELILKVKKQIGQPSFRELTFSKEKQKELKRDFFSKASNEPYLPNRFVMVVEKRQV